MLDLPLPLSKGLERMNNQNHAACTTSQLHGQGTRYHGYTVIVTLIFTDGSINFASRKTIHGDRSSMRKQFA